MHAMHSNDDHFTNEIQFSESFHARQISKNKNSLNACVACAPHEPYENVGLCRRRKKNCFDFSILNSERRMRQFQHTRRAPHDPTTTHQVSFIDSKLNPHRSSATDQLNGSHRIQFLQIAFEIHKIPQFYTTVLLFICFHFTSAVFPFFRTLLNERVCSHCDVRLVCVCVCVVCWMRWVSRLNRLYFIFVSALN